MGQFLHTLAPNLLTSLFTVDECPLQRMSTLTNVHFDECPLQRMSTLTNVCFDKCPPRPVFAQAPLLGDNKQA
jgi:hypothetical protein